VAKDRSRVALRVHFKVDGDCDAIAGGGGGAKRGGGKPGGVAMGLKRKKLELVNIIKKLNQLCK